MDNHGVTLTQYLDPVWREAWIRKTGFVDVLSLHTAKSQRGTTRPSGNVDIPDSQAMIKTDCVFIIPQLGEKKGEPISSRLGAPVQAYEGIWGRFCFSHGGRSPCVVSPPH